MSEGKKQLNEKQLKKVAGGTPGARFIVIDYDIQCEHCDYVGPMTYEEGTETGANRLVYAHCPKCLNTQIVGLGTE